VESQTRSRPGKLQFKMSWAPDGQQQMDCKVDRVKAFVRPNCFLRIAHFFGYGYPEFDMTCEDRPNSYEADFEKLPVMQMKLDILESMICMESFDPADMARYRGSQAASEHEAQFPPDSSGRAPASSAYARQHLSDGRRGTASRRHTTAMPTAGTAAGRGTAAPEDPLKASPDGQEGKVPSNLTTIVCKAQRIEYVYGREQISQVKEALAGKLQEYARSRPRARQASAGAPEGGAGEQLGAAQIDSSVTKAPGVEPASLAKPDLLGLPQPPDSREPEEKGPSASTPRGDGEATEVGRQSYMRMLLKIRQFAPYICDSVDLDNFGFEGIQKRQLISPLDITFSHSKLLRVEAGGSGKPARFTPYQKNVADIGKTLFKVTFSDVLVLQETSSRLLESQQQYEDHLVEYLRERAKEEGGHHQEPLRLRSVAGARAERERRGSFLAFGTAGRAARAREESF